MKKSGEVLASGWLEVRKDGTPIFNDCSYKIYNDQLTKASLLTMNVIHIHIIRAKEGRKRK